jgi:hypothetical protein
LLPLTATATIVGAILAVAMAKMHMYRTYTIKTFKVYYIYVVVHTGKHTDNYETIVGSWNWNLQLLQFNIKYQVFQP